MLIVGARVSHPDPRINVGFREGTIIGAGEGMDDAVRLVYSCLLYTSPSPRD